MGADKNAYYSFITVKFNNESPEKPTFTVFKHNGTDRKEVDPSTASTEEGNECLKRYLYNDVRYHNQKDNHAKEIKMCEKNHVFRLDRRFSCKADEESTHRAKLKDMRRYGNAECNSFKDGIIQIHKFLKTTQQNQQSG